MVVQYDGNLEFLQTINILEQQQIYKEASLNAYISNDPIAVQMNALQASVNTNKYFTGRNKLL